MKAFYRTTNYITFYLCFLNNKFYWCRVDKHQHSFSSLEDAKEQVNKLGKKTKRNYFYN